MTKDPDPTIKPALLEQVLQYLLANGISNLSLRPLASELDTTPRKLLYHFGSKEQMIVESLELAQQQYVTMLSSSPPPAGEWQVELERLWQQLTTPDAAMFMKLLFEVEMQAMKGNELYQAFAVETLGGWRMFMKSRLEGCDDITANLVVNVFSGLLLDYFLTDDETRILASFRAFTAMLGGKT
jgi:AcrR family transcriptional regulator